MKNKTFIQVIILLIIALLGVWGVSTHVNQWNRLQDRNTYLEQTNKDLRTQNIMLMEEQW